MWDNHILVFVKILGTEQQILFNGLSVDISYKFVSSCLAELGKVVLTYLASLGFGQN